MLLYRQTQLYDGWAVRRRDQMACLAVLVALMQPWSIGPIHYRRMRAFAYAYMYLGTSAGWMSWATAWLQVYGLTKAEEILQQLEAVVDQGAESMETNADHTGDHQTEDPGSEHGASAASNAEGQEEEMAGAQEGSEGTGIEHGHSHAHSNGGSDGHHGAHEDQVCRALLLHSRNE
eukprot:scaffold102794_cov42-Prasinocladus_malaysianus.AAC.1